jgi:ribosomal protein L37AE/L43A
MTDNLKLAIELSKKRERLCALQPKCEKCGTNQVQLFAWIDSVHWKCRHCGYKWDGAA